jgi:hypothetical protein
VRRSTSRSLALFAASAAVLGFALPAHAAQKAEPTPSPTPGQSSPASKPGQRATFGIGPIQSGGTNPFFSYETAPGGVYVDKVGLFNFTPDPVTLSVYPADLGNSADGGVTASLQKAKATDVGSWITLPKAVVTVTLPGAGPKGPGFATLPFRVNVPATVTPGDHAGAIVASLRTLGKNPLGQNIYLDQRLGARVYIRVAGDVRPELTVEDVHADYAGSLNPFTKGTAVVSYRVTNTGNVRLGAKQTVSVRGVVGSSVPSEPLQDIKVLLPGGSAQVTTRVAGVLPLGLMTASVTLDPVVPEASDVKTAPEATGSARFWAVPWLLVAVLLALLLALGWWLRRRRATSPEAPVGRRQRAAGSGPGPDDLVSSGRSSGRTS